MDSTCSNQATNNEQSPLLRPTSPAEHPYHGSKARSQIWLLLFLVAGLDFTMFALNLPLTRVYEALICYQYYSNQHHGLFPDPISIPEERCKIDPVQDEVAVVRGFELLFMSLPGVLLAIPYGMLADRWGRRNVLLLSILGLVGAVTAVLLVCCFWWIFPLRLVWLAWSFTVVGGGATVLTSTVFSMLTDLTSDDERGRIFLVLATAVFCSQAIATPVSSFLMGKFGTMIPIMIGYFTGVLIGILCFFVEETVQKTKPPGRFSHQDPQVPQASDEMIQSPTKPWHGRLSAHGITQIKSLISTFTFNSPGLVAIVLAFFINTIGTSSINIAVQYSSTQFNLPISSAGLLVTIRSTMAAITFLFALPLLGSLLVRKFSLDLPSRDMWLSRLTCTCIPLGFLLMTVAPNIVLMAIGMVLTAIGSGSGSLLRSVATNMVHSDQVARLNGAIGMVDTFGAVVSGPLLAETFMLGSRVGWRAFPFFVATVLTTITSTIVWCIKFSKPSE